MDPFARMGFEKTPAGMIECATHGLVDAIEGACRCCVQEASDPAFVQCADHGSQKKTAEGICPMCKALGRTKPLSAFPTPMEVAAEAAVAPEETGGTIGTAPFQRANLAPPKPNPPGEAERKWKDAPGSPKK